MSVARFAFLFLMSVVIGCSSPIGDFTLLKDNPQGRWQFEYSATGEKSYFNVGLERIDFGGHKFFAVSESDTLGEVKGFLIVSDADAPSGSSVLWLSELSDSTELDIYTTYIEKMESDEIVIRDPQAGDELGRLKRLN